MGFDFRFAARPGSSPSTSIDDLLNAAGAGALTASAGGPRARKRRARAKLANAGIVASLLAAEGCKTVGKNDIPLGGEDGGGDDAGAGAGGNSGNASAGVGNNGGSAGGGATDPAPGQVELDAQNDTFHTEMSAPLEISASDLQSNDIHDHSGPLEIVRVFDAAHGTVHYMNGVAHFTPQDGFTGVASFKYEVRDSHGDLSIATVEIHVGDMGDGGGTGGHDHGGDEGDGGGGHEMMPEHMATMNLVLVSEATHVAVNNGSWFDPNTWAGGEVPGEGAKVVIPEGVMVMYDGESNASLFTVRVDGMLHFATDADTFMEVDTMVVTGAGHLTIGTVDNPVEASVETVIQFADNGPIDVGWDPLLLSRGLITMGDVEIHGAHKDTFLKTAVDPMAGDTSMTLETAPEGWQVGDRIVLTGTHLPEVEWVPVGEQRAIETEDEELVITAIDGNVIHFDRALEYDHEAPAADLHAYVANYTRNVRFETENADDLPVYQRGHVMLMHADTMDVRYAEFSDLGRTDKSERAFDVNELSSTQYDTNVKARYPLHIHHGGVEDIEDPVMLVGNAVWGSPGWGVVHHDSNAILADNAVYDAFGAAFVAETGNETGRWSHNIAIKSIGVAGIGNLGNPKGADDVNSFDLGRTGAGFWFQGRIVDAVDNVAAGIPSGQAYVYFSRAGNDGAINVLSKTAPQPESLNYLDEAFIYQPAISQFVNNEALASNVGFMVVKQNAEQGHDIHSVIDEFTAWEVRYGVHLEYTAHYIVKDTRLIASDNGQDGYGVGTGPNTLDLVVNNVDIVGFHTGVDLDKTVTFDGFNNAFEYFFIDVDISGAAQDYRNLNGDPVLSGDSLIHQLKFDSGLGDFPLFETPGSWFMTLPGVKTDSLGDQDIYSVDVHRFRWEGLKGAIEEEGYWTLPDGRAVTVFERYFADRTTGELIKVPTYVEIGGGVAYGEQYAGDGPGYRGVLDVDSNAPVAGDDAVTVDAGGSVLIDVLANDFDPDGDLIELDGLVHPEHGEVYAQDNGSVLYVPDPNYVGSDEFWYWVQDNNGVFSQAHVQVTVEA